jgi:hypothetical protein
MSRRDVKPSKLTADEALELIGDDPQTKGTN